ncbi:MAG: glycosyl hydrolase, partial [Acholeplasmataceae bacterium]|nr:glycosyl hydrolase [Acholeplasmataceae bacterium]
FKRYGKKSSKLVKKAVELANKSDVILLYLGLDEISEVEGIDRKDLKFPENQINLVEELKKTGKKIVLILTSGSTTELDFIENANAVIHGYLPGQAGMSGLLNLVYGKVNPSGRLSESIAYKLDDYPATPYFLKDDNIAEYRESIFVGYRYFNTRGVKVRYPFGYGLSYTKFSKEVVKLDDTGITVRIKNIGKHPGKDVIQMYIGKKDSDIFRASKELKGFVKVHLEVDEEKEVKIPFDDYSFRYFDISTSEFEVEGGEYQIYLGNSVEDIYYEGSLIVEGSNIKPYELDQLVNYFKADVHNITDLEFSELLRREIPKVEKARTKRGKIIVDLETTVADLREARGWTGRFLSFAVRNGSKFLMKIGKKTLGLTLIMGVYNQPMRTLSRMTGGMIDMKQLNGLIIMFNGKFFKGLRAFMKAGKQKKKLLKYEKERVKKT